MCVVEHYEEIYPNGHREPHNHRRYCNWGGPNRDCGRVRHTVIDNVYIDLPRAPQPPPAAVEGVPSRRRHGQTGEEETRGRRRFSNNLRFVLNFGNPFSRMSNRKKEYVVVRRHGKPQLERRHPRRRSLSPRRDPPWSPRYSDPCVIQVPEQGQYLRQDRRIVQLPPREPHDYPIIEPREVRQSRERRRESSSSSSSESPPISPVRQHRRRHSRSSSNTVHTDDLRHLREECSRLERDIRHLREEADVRAQRVRDANAEVRHVRFVEPQRRIGHDYRPPLESADQARRRQEQDDTARLRAQRAQQEERERMERTRAAGLPRRPRAGAVVHQSREETLTERGVRVINEAVRADENGRCYDDLNPPPGQGWERRRDVGGGLQRRDAVAIGQRRVYEDDRRRGGRRWI